MFSQNLINSNVRSSLKALGGRAEYAIIGPPNYIYDYFVENYQVNVLNKVINNNLYF